MTVSIPGSDITKQHLDAASDDPAQARAELAAAIDRINTLRQQLNGIESELNSIEGHSSALDTLLDNYSEQTVELGGSFGAGESVKCSRVGNQVTIASVSGSLNHVNTGTAISNTGAIPASFRPNEDVFNCYFVSDTTDVIARVSIISDGRLITQYAQLSDGLGSSREDTAQPPLISFLV